MKKTQLLALIAKKEARKAELSAKANASEDVKELRSINTELDTLNSEITELRSIADSLKDEAEDNNNEFRSEMKPGQAAASTTEQRGDEFKPMGTYAFGQASEERNKEQERKFEQRGADLKDKKTVTFELEELPEFRAVTIGGGTLVVTKHQSNTLNPTFNEVSKVIDLVNAIPLIGGESYQKGFEVSSGEGDYTTENGDYKDADPTVDYVTIGKAKITAYSEISDEAIKLPNINYQAIVAKNIGIALRKKVSKQILVGPGGANALVGIFNAPTNVIPTVSDIGISEIDEDTLDKIVFGFGGDEDVEGGGYLILSKKDLAAFAAVRTTDGKKAYKIKKNGNVGTISSEDSYEIPYIINSACPVLSASGTAVDTKCMAYGMMTAYELPVFSAITVEESRDFKFKQGQIAYRGSVWAGGNVAMYKGFVRIKKVAAT